MAESLKEVIARRLSSSQQSDVPVAPASTQEVAPTPVVEVPQEVEGLSEVPEIEPATAPETPATAPDVPVAESPVINQDKNDEVEQSDEQSKIEEIFREIELLQNNGRFRVELLHQLNEINKSLSVVSQGITKLMTP